MGMLRILLAMAVLLGHTGGIGGYVATGGPVAVQAFYIISGFYMGLVLNERYDRPALNRVFYVNRAIRIYGMYALFLALYLAVMIAAQRQGGASPLWPYLQNTVSLPEKVGLGVLNLTILGQDITFHLAMADGHLVWTDHPFGRAGGDVFQFMLIPMAWSMALELYFYGLAPFVARRLARQIALLLALSLAARIAAAQFGLTADPYSYRFFPFELALFLAGVLGYKAWAATPRRWEGRGPRLLALAVPATLLAYPWLIGTWSPDTFFSPARIGTLLLVALALPAIHAWSRRSSHDRRVGELSYPLYLSHMLVLGLLPRTGLLVDPSWRTIAVIAVSLVLSWLVVRCVDQGIERGRRRLAARAGADAQKGGDISPAFA